MIYKNACINGKRVDIKAIDGKISYIGKTDKDGFDTKNRKVFAGLVDIHSHGCIGFDTMDGTHLDEMSAFMEKNGVTSWLPTTMLPTTMSMGMDTIKRVVNGKILNSKGAEVLGYHLEGPYISAKYKGRKMKNTARYQ